MDFPLVRSDHVDRLLDNSDPQQLAKTRISDMADAMTLALSRNRNPEDLDPDPYGYATELENQNGWDLLPSEWKARPDDDNWNKRFRGRARKAVVSKLFLQGHTVPEIAQKVNTTEAIVRQDLDNISREFRRNYLDDIELLAGKDLARLETYLVKLAPAIERGDTKAITAALEIIKERGSILGYRAGVQVDIETYVREVAEANGFDPQRAVDLAQRILITMK